MTKDVPCVLDCLGYLDVECVSVLIPRFFALAEPCFYPPDMDGLDKYVKKKKRKNNV